MPKISCDFPTRIPNLSLHLLCRVLHGVNDMLITGTTTKISFQSVPDFVFGGAGISLKELMRRDDHARRAEAALQPVALPKSVLYRMKLAILREAGSIDGIVGWQEITPDEHHDWIDQRDVAFRNLHPLGSKEVKAGRGDHAVFGLYSRGLATSRDAYPDFAN